MNILGLESITFGVDDLATARRFWNDFGLSEAENGADGAIFETREKATIVVRAIDDPDLAPAPVEGNTAREFTWGLETQEEVDAIAEELSKDRQITWSDDDAVHAVDPVGYGIAFKVSRREAVAPEPQEINTPGASGRINKRAPVYDKATPIHLSHMVILVPNIEETKDFYVDRLGFKLTDSYPGRGYFLRAGASNEHHNLFLLKAGENKGFNHIAFELGSIHELFGGGTHMMDKGWETHLGPGRHPISSCYFWYFKNPCGGAAEYDFDSDFITDEWNPKDWESAPGSFAEWTLAEGIQRYETIQTGKI
jgi:catechol 2,3-dioxygenase-like lactoylglutathione lyase family enzyme